MILTLYMYLSVGVILGTCFLEVDYYYSAKLVGNWNIFKFKFPKASVSKISKQ